jgi:ADP-heptose:LPS heptosyltransferase
LKTDEHAPVRGARRVVILRLRSLGDCVLTTPAIHLLKRARPEVEIGVVVEPVWRAVYSGNPDIATILAPTLREVRGFKADLAIDLHGGNTASRLTLFSGAAVRAGFGHYKRRLAYNLLIPRAQEIFGQERPVHTAEHVASAMFYLGVDGQAIPRARLFTEAAQDAGYAVFHPVAATPEKTWHAAGFIEVAEHVRRQHSLQPVFIAAAGQDLSAFRDFRCIAGAPLEQVKRLISGASLFVGNDSGPAHIAAAFGVPPVVIFGPSDPAIWGPWGTPGEVVKAAGPIAGVNAEQVIAAIEHLRVAA